MDKGYWLGRGRSATAMARRAATAQARLIHYDLAGLYSVKAAHCAPTPERAQLELPRPEPGPAAPTWRRPGGERS
jgi:hypothetical protein